jgi:hypothetical protein
VKRGTCQFGLKVALAGSSGAAGIVVYNNVAGANIAGTLANFTRPEGPYVAVGFISLENGTALISTIAINPVVGNLVSITTNELRYSTNVLATTKIGDQNNLILAGGHTDSVPAGPVITLKHYFLQVVLGNN